MSFLRTHSRKLRLVLRVLTAVAVVSILKLAAHWLHWEVISLNPLFSGIVAASIFVLGFLLAGVLADYKESERLPGELACSLGAIADEALSICKTKQAPAARDCLAHTLDLTVFIRDWFHEKRSTKDIVAKLDTLNDFFIDFEPLTAANFIVRLKQEHTNVRRIFTRIEIIRDTSFISSGYMIAGATTALLAIGLILTKMTPFYESLFFIGVIVSVLIFLNLLIADLDNPFGYADMNSVENVSLKPVDDLIDRIQSMSLGAGLPPLTGRVQPPDPPV